MNSILNYMAKNIHETNMDVINEGLRSSFKFKKESMTFKSIEEAQNYFFEKFGVNSDDSDKEQARVERWIEDNEIVIEE